MSFAMPETGIDFPDWVHRIFIEVFYHFGFYLGLTGERIGYQIVWRLV